MPRPKQKTSKRSAKTQRKSPPRVGKGAKAPARAKATKKPQRARVETRSLDRSLVANARARELAQLPSAMVLAERRPPAEGWTDYLDAVGQGATERNACILARVAYSSMQSYVKADKEREEAEADARELFISALLEEGRRLAMMLITEGVTQDEEGHATWTKRDARIAAVKLNAIRWILSTRAPGRFAETTKQEHSGPNGAPLSTVTRYVYELPQNPLLLGERGHEEDDDG